MTLQNSFNARQDKMTIINQSLLYSIQKHNLKLSKFLDSFWWCTHLQDWL